MLPSCRNQSIGLQRKSIKWLNDFDMVGILVDNGLRPTALCCLKKEIIGIYTILTQLKELECIID